MTTLGQQLLGAVAGTPRLLATGDVLVTEGEESDEVFVVESGRLEVLVGGEVATRVGLIGAAELAGEVTALGGGRRTATLRAVEPTVVRIIERREFNEWLENAPGALDAVGAEAERRADLSRVAELVMALLLEPDPALVEDIVAVAELVRLKADEVLFEEGAESDAGYIVVTGRVLVQRRGDDGQQVPVAEIGRGELVGEIGLVERAPRSATIRAMRDSTLARFPWATFLGLTAKHPALMLNLSRTLVSRMGRPRGHLDRARSIAVVVTSPSAGRDLVPRLVDEIGRHGSAVHLWPDRVDDMLSQPGISQVESGVSAPRLTEFLHEIEMDHDYLVFEADPAATAWTTRSVHHGDRILLVVSAAPGEHEMRQIRELLAGVPAGVQSKVWLALLHPPDTTRPRDTGALMDRVGSDRVVHVRSGSGSDEARLARLVTGNGLGLVLGGGGARGFAHVGVHRALHELGIPIDTIGGASIGAPLGAGMALDISNEDLLAEVKRLFHGLLDYTIPVVSLVKGTRITRNIADAFEGFDLLDLWLPFFCVSTNLTRSRVEIHARGDAVIALRASVAIPGVLPPVPVGDDLLVDAGVLNNLPADVMRADSSIRDVIAVDVSAPEGPRVTEDFGLSVSGWRAFRDRRRKEGSRYPGLSSVLLRTMVLGSVRDRDQLLEEGAIDVYLDLDLGGVGMLDFETVTPVADLGYEAAMPRLEAWLESGGPGGARVSDP